MAVESYQTKLPVSMTEPAIAHVRELLLEKGASGLRFGADKSGCSGYMYVLDFIDEPGENDSFFELADGVSIYIDKTLLPILHGTRIDYVTEGLNAQMKFDNPNAQGHCGCGESFTV